MLSHIVKVTMPVRKIGYMDVKVLKPISGSILT